MKLKDILKIEKCPYCGDNLGYYTKVFAFGWLQDNTLYSKELNGNREKYNNSMYDSLNYGKIHKTCYCMNCHKAIGIDKSN